MGNFQLISDFKATGDQPQAIEKLVWGAENGLREQVLLGVTGSGKTFTMAKVIEQAQRPTLVLAHNKTLAAQLCAEFKEFFPNNAVEYFVSYYDYYQPEAYIPHTDTYIAKDASTNDEIDRLRLSATCALLERRDVIVVASVSCIYGLGDPIDYKSMVISLRTGMEKNRDELIKKLNRNNMYTIAKVTAFQDYHYGLNNVDEGLFSTGGAYLWRDDMGCYWLSPSSQKYQSYLVQIATELRGLGFDEVVFDQFVFPDSTKYRFSGDKQEALTQAADKLVDTCATSSFAVSFVSTQNFQQPEGRSRLYLTGVEPADLNKVASSVAVPDNIINLVFLTAYHDTRYDAYSVLRPITAMR